jgi:hypothetical protein
MRCAPPTRFPQPQVIHVEDRWVRFSGSSRSERDSLAYPSKLASAKGDPASGCCSNGDPFHRPSILRSSLHESSMAAGRACGSEDSECEVLWRERRRREAASKSQRQVSPKLRVSRTLYAPQTSSIRLHRYGAVNMTSFQLPRPPAPPESVSCNDEPSAHRKDLLGRNTPHTQPPL